MNNSADNSTTMSVKEIKNPNIKCLFTENDWAIWEKLDLDGKIRNLPNKGLFKIITKKIPHNASMPWFSTTSFYKCVRCEKEIPFYEKDQISGNYKNGRRLLMEHIVKTHIDEKGMLTP